ncbi:Serine/threonine-protein kinase/endoribonuclease IRE2, partial [Chytridiales sp. JEL 0842]
TIKDPNIAAQELEMMQLITEKGVPYTLKLIDVIRSTDLLPSSDLSQSDLKSSSSSASSSNSDISLCDSSPATQPTATPPGTPPATQSTTTTTEISQSITLVLPLLEPLPNRNIDLWTVATQTRQLMTALAGLHELNIVHLDVTPPNLLRDPTSQTLVLIDFGLAVQCQDGKPHPYGRGTLGYIAPELLESDPPKCTSTSPDMYSAGVCVGQWLHPFLQGFSLEYLGSKLVKTSTTSFISSRLRDAVIKSSPPAPPPSISTSTPFEGLRTSHSHLGISSNVFGVSGSYTYGSSPHLPPPPPPPSESEEGDLITDSTL